MFGVMIDSHTILGYSGLVRLLVADEPTHNHGNIFCRRVLKIKHFEERVKMINVYVH